jgi:hypothetical protein
MDDIQRISLARFSRLYLRSLNAVANATDDSLKPAVSRQVSENRFADQVVLGMSQNRQAGDQSSATFACLVRSSPS